MKCAKCNHCKFTEYKSGVNRFYCEHPAAAASVNASARLIAKTKRHERVLTIKTAPRWCPLKAEEPAEAEA